jgi:HK97 family phage major capsid protein
MYRKADLSLAGLDKQARTVSLSFSSEKPVDRGEYDEVLSHDPADVDMSRLVNGAPVLREHNPSRHIGTVEGAIISSQHRLGRASIRFGRSRTAREAWKDLIDGVLKKASVGYERLHEVAKETLADGRQLIRFAWRPFEISLVSIAADDSVGVGRSKSKIMNNNDGPSREERRAHLSTDYRRVEIMGAAEAVAANFPHARDRIMTMASRAVLEHVNPQEFNRNLLEVLGDIQQQNPPRRELVEDNLGMNQREVGRYSIARAIASVVKEGRVTGLEAEASRACERALGIQAQGFMVPLHCLAPIRATRDLNVTTFGQGGAFVPTSILTPIIEILRNKTTVVRLGAKVMAGLQGNIAIPRETAPGTAYSLAESATLTKSTQAIDQVSLTPHRVGATNDYTKQLLLQSSVDVENFIREDLLAVIGIKLDKLALEGAGSNSEPTGILHTPAIGSVTFGATATFAKMVAFETSLASANADRGRMAYITSPAVRGALKTTPKVANSTFPIFLWEDGPNDGTDDGRINGYRAAATNQISNNLVAFGNWEELILAIWGGYDVVVNPFTRDTDAVVRITINTFVDIAVRHAASFCWSSDAGNQ